MNAIDLFAGIGGSSTGATQAGCKVLWAANHWPEAVAYHAANHPDTIHACQDLQQANWHEVPSHDIMLASPCCQGHSKARGKAHGNPQHDASRATANAAVAAAEVHRPYAFIVENVPEFMDWVLFPTWRASMEALGYSLSFNVLDSADHGVPQHRSRLYVVGTRSKKPIQLKLPKQPHVAAREFINLDAGSWQPINKPGRAAATLRRVARARQDGFGHTFLMPYYGNGSGLTGRSLDRPIGTITTRDRWAIVRGDSMRMISTDESRAAMGLPPDIVLPRRHKPALHMMGNAVTPATICKIINELKESA